MPLSLPLLAFALAVPRASPETLPPPRPVTHTAADVRRLARDARGSHPVRLIGVVTYADPGEPVFYVQDDTAGVMVRRAPGLAAPRPGDLVAVDGTVRPGSFPPELTARTVTRLGAGSLPDLVHYDLSRGHSRWLDGQYVEVWAVVQTVHSPTAAGAPLGLRVSTAAGTGLVVVPGGDAAAAWELRGATVHVRGVLRAGFGEGGTVALHPTILCTALPRQVGSGPAEPVAVARLADLRRFVPDRPVAPRLVRVAGVVTAAPAADTLLVQDDTAGAVVRLTAPASSPPPGTRVELVGLLDVRGPRLVLDRATVTRTSPGSEPEPKSVPAEDLAGGSWDGRLVRLDARVEEVREQDGRTVLAVLAGTVPFDVVVPGTGPTERFPHQAIVRLTGVATGLSLDGPAGGFVLVARSADDVEVLRAPQPPPFWTHRRAALAAAALAGLCILGTVWVGTLRHRVRSQTEQMRRQLEHESVLDARYRDLFEGAGDAVWVTDRDGSIVALNRAGEALLGLTRDEAMGRRIAEFIPPDEAGLARASQVTRLGVPYELTVVSLTGTTAVVEVSSQVLPDGGVQTIARNVTERKRHQDRAQRVQKLEAIGRLAGGIAHDFNNLLTVINGSAELLRDRLPEGEPTRALADEVLDAGNRAANLTRQLLAFSRQRFVAPAPLDLNETVAGTAGLLRRLIGEDVTLVTELSPDAPWVLAEAGLIEQVLMNLAINARDAMPKGGTLTVRTAAAPGGLARLTVVDTGVGMDEATQARVFEPFYTTKPVGQGTGLGLATVYGVVQTLGGVIRFTSERGRGTVFEVDLPALDRGQESEVGGQRSEVGGQRSEVGGQRTEVRGQNDGQPLSDLRPPTSDLCPPTSDSPPGPDLAAPTPIPNTLGAWGRPYTVLLVEDDESVRGLTRSILEDQGLTVLTAEDGPAALAL
ncbi:MAG TPA: ATP-binding protein, partial [Fimbriiglobus sp.]|nr:ATP-binding protein [Fimbriiglobus sp.]